MKLDKMFASCIFFLLLIWVFTEYYSVWKMLSYFLKSNQISECCIFSNRRMVPIGTILSIRYNIPCILYQVYKYLLFSFFLKLSYVFWNFFWKNVAIKWLFKFYFLLSGQMCIKCKQIMLNGEFNSKKFLYNVAKLLLKIILSRSSRVYLQSLQHYL